MTTSVVVLPNAELVAAAAAARLLTFLLDRQTAGQATHLALTGGGVGTATLDAVKKAPLAAAIEWNTVHVYWGDERFVASDDNERNELQARQTLLNHIRLPEENIHPMGASDWEGIGSAHAAAQLYQNQLPDRLDLVLLGMGPDGHVASLFPQLTAVDSREPVVAVYDSPKPPPTRISLTLPVITAASQVWLLVAGEPKAPALARAIAGQDIRRTPAAGARGRDHTFFLVDEAAAAELQHPNSPTVS